jgi:hypothetical protein
MQCDAMQEGSARRLEEAWVRAGVWASLIGSATGGGRGKQSQRKQASYVTRRVVGAVRGDGVVVVVVVVGVMRSVL